MLLTLATTCSTDTLMHTHTLTIPPTHTHTCIHAYIHTHTPISYVGASILNPGTYSASSNYSILSASCSSSAVEYELSSCITSLGSSSCSQTIPVCSEPVGIRCYGNEIIGHDHARFGQCSQCFCTFISRPRDMH